GLLLARIDAAVLRAIDPREDRAWRNLVIEARLLEEPLDELHLIRVVEDREALREPDALAVAAQEARARGVERADPHRVRTVAEELAQALAHLPGRLVRERDGEDLPR